MGTEGENGSSRIWKKVGLSGVVAAVGAGVGLLLTAKPKRLRETVSELPGNARNLVEDLTQRARPGGDDADGTGSPMPQEISDEFEARRRDRRERRERRRHTTT
jgi:hypothetical protein